MELQDRVALVTGADRGIGRAIAVALAVAGAHVAVGYRSGAAAAEATAPTGRGDRAGVRGCVPGELGVAVEVGGLSGAHARDMAAGWRGFQLADRRPRDRAEPVLEAYYLVRVVREVEVSADFQEIWNPGMNGDRGPAPVVPLRVHVHR